MGIGVLLYKMNKMHCWWDVVLGRVKFVQLAQGSFKPSRGLDTAIDSSLCFT